MKTDRPPERRMEIPTNDTAYERTTCRLCGSESLQSALQLEPTPLADAYVSEEQRHEKQIVYPLDLLCCASCGFSQTSTVVHPDEIYLEYLYQSQSSLGLEEHFRDHARSTLRKWRLKPGALVVDVGSNDAMLLRAFKQEGLRVLGVEPAADIARRATASGVETLPEFFNEATARQIRQRYGAADLLTANNVFANIDDLHDFTRGIRHLLADDGLFIFESFYLLDQMRNMVFDFTYHEHLSYFSVAPLVRFFESLDLALIDVEPIPTKGGSFRCTVQPAHGRRPVQPSVERLIEEERRLRIHEPAGFRRWERLIDTAKQTVLEHLQSVKAGGATVAGYGASATTTTLLYHFKLGRLIDYLVDENPAKIGRYSPGLHHPVLAPAELEARKPDWVFVFAWRFWQPITAKHESYTKQGGKWLIPLPEMKSFP